MRIRTEPIQAWKPGEGAKAVKKKATMHLHHKTYFCIKICIFIYAAHILSQMLHKSIHIFLLCCCNQGFTADHIFLKFSTNPTCCLLSTWLTWAARFIFLETVISWLKNNGTHILSHDSNCLFWQGCVSYYIQTPYEHFNKFKSRIFIWGDLSHYHYRLAEILIL